LTFSNFAKHSLIYSDSHWGDWSLVWGDMATKTPLGDGTGSQQTSISKTVLPNHAT